jgi:hypothetical protein
MAPSRSPIELANKASVVISLRNVLSILFLERISNTIMAGSYSTLWTDHEKAEYMTASQRYFLINDLKRGILSCLVLVSLTFMDKLIFMRKGIMHKFYQRE